ncbi:hypothetical protein, conserved [Eimeria tenella]|uniref:Uncharacterized protein n=1 Tax=Eimeria tenella TaxID=5802 RepID=U6KUE6_EIMTE|nr:hypothetical protein, conserved [Eimeria tenella]CDJ41777.1 hypothetical protein, conserved [Eimeria tenella]|eukprot:XP_013232527.1 hypothetical protein, conserved [Eimeria tenella]
MDEVADVPYEGVIGWLLCRRMLPEDYHVRLKGALLQQAQPQKRMQQQQQQQQQQQLELPQCLCFCAAGMTAHINLALEKPPESPEACRFIKERKECHFGYKEINSLVEILQKEGATEGILAKAFGSAVYRQWRRLQRTFQQQNLHLADISRALARAANVLVPAQQKTLQQKQRMLADSEKKEQQLQQAAAAAEEVYRQLCTKYGIEEAAAADPLLLQKQLQVYVHRKLPVRLQQAQQLLQLQGEQLLSFYHSFAAYATSGALSKEGEAPLLPLLRLVAAEGNMAVAAAAAAAPEIALLQQQLQQQQQQQDAQSAVQIEIQQQGEEGAPQEGAPAADTRDWIVEEGIEDSSSSSSSSSSSIKDTLLGNDTIRRQLLLELMELRGFLYSRVLQSAAATNSSKNKQQQQQQQNWQETTSLPSELQRKKEELLGYQDCVEQLQELLGGAETLQLLQLLHNQAALDSLSNEVAAARAACQKPLSAAKEQQRKQATLKSEVAAATAALEKQRRELQQLQELLQQQMATAICRKVRITGIPRERLP